jgi:hypothetical protein
MPARLDPVLTRTAQSPSLCPGAHPNQEVYWIGTSSSLLRRSWDSRDDDY